MSFPQALDKIGSRWWMLLLRGALGIVLGISILAAPGAGLIALVTLFGIYAILDGAAAVFLGIPRRFGLVALGVLSILAGVLAFSRPLLTATALIYAIAIWAIAIGLVQLFDAFFRREGQGIDWLTALAGLAALVLGGVILSNPGAGLLSVVAFAGVYAVVSGIAYAILAFQVRGLRKRVRNRLTPAGSAA